MATIFDTLETALQGNGLAGALTSVTGSLTGVSSLIGGSKGTPPASISGFGPALRSLPLPNIDIASAFGSSFASLKSALPSDPSAITGGLTSGLTQLKTSGGDLTGQLGEALKVIQALYQLTELDFTGAAPPGQGGQPGGGGGGQPGGGGGGPQQPAAPAAAAAIAQAHTALAGLPSPFTIDSFLTWFHGVLESATLDDFGIRQIPVITELRDYLGTLLAWKDAAPAAIGTQLANTLAALDAFLAAPLAPVLTPLTSASTALVPKLHAAQLAQLADDITARLGELKTPVVSGTLAGAGATITSLTALLDQYDQLKLTLTADLAPLPALQSQLQNLPSNLDTEMGRAASALRPAHSLALFDHITDGIAGSQAAIQEPLDQVRAFLGRLVAWLQDFLDKINFKAVTQPIADAAAAMHGLVDDLDNGMVAATMQVQQVFGQVEAVLNLLDPAQAATAAQSAVDAFKAQIVQKVAGLLQPALNAVAQVVAAINQGVQTFNPEQLKAILHDAIQEIAGVLADPRVAAVRKDLDQVAQALESLSFAPFTSEVVKDMEAIADVLKSLGDLPSPLDDALHSALSVLPDDLQPITDPIIDEFAAIVEAGPVQVLNAVADLPKQLADKIREFDPTSLVGDALTAPYNKLLSDMEGFKPSSLLDPIKAELDSFKDRLKENVNPANALSGLEAPFQELSKALDNFHPDELVAALDEKLQEVLSGLTATIPLDDVFDQVDAAVKRVKDAIDTAASVTTALDKVRGILQGLANPQAQLDTWLTPILAKLDGLGNTAAMQQSLTSVSASVDGLTLTAVTAKVDTAVAPLVTALTTLNPQARWTAVVQAYRALPSDKINDLPASGQKNQLKAALARLDPAVPASSAPYQTLAALSQSIASTRTGLATALAGWDAQYTGPDAVLGGLRNLDPTPANVKQWIHDTVTDEFIRPLAGVFSLASPAFGIVDALASELSALMTDVQAKVDDLLQGVTALTSIRDSLQELFDRIQNFDLDFLRDSLKSLFTNLRAKLDAVNPAGLAAALNTIFDTVLDSLGVDLFLPPATVAAIDADYAALIQTLKSLDPANVIANVVQDEFEEDVLPLLDMIDMSGPLHRITERLPGLVAELKTELGKVEDAFEAMVNAIPEGAAA